MLTTIKVIWLWAQQERLVKNVELMAQMAQFDDYMGSVSLSAGFSINSIPTWRIVGQRLGLRGYNLL